MKFPEIKKDVKKFFLDESGKISKKSILKIGIITSLVGVSLINSVQAGHCSDDSDGHRSGGEHINAATHCSKAAEIPTSGICNWIPENPHASGTDHGNHGNTSHESAHCSADGSTPRQMHCNDLNSVIEEGKITVKHTHEVKDEHVNGGHANNHGSGNNAHMSGSC